MKATSTEGIVHALAAHTVGYGTDEHVVGTMVTIRTRVDEEEKGWKNIDTKVFLLPNSTLPVMGDKVVVFIGAQEDVELEALSTEASLALGITREDKEE